DARTPGCRVARWQAAARCRACVPGARSGRPAHRGAARARQRERSRHRRAARMTGSEVASLAASHLRISLLALALGSLVALPLGLSAARRPRFERAVLATASVIQTIPGLALLA